jgi:phospholipid transport system substrate-binding protein
VIAILLIYFAVQVPIQFASANERAVMAQQLIQNLSEQSSSILSNQNNSLSEREDNLVRLLEKNFDLESISKFVVGPKWETLSNAQKNIFTELFSDFYLRAYGSQLGGYPGDRLEIISAKDRGRKDSFVMTRLERRKRKPVILRWRVREIDGELLITDLFIGQTSVALSHREHFDKVMKDEGIAGLITLLTIRAERLPAQPHY